MKAKGWKERKKTALRRLYWRQLGGWMEIAQGYGDIRQDDEDESEDWLPGLHVASSLEEDVLGPPRVQSPVCPLQ